MSNTGNPARQAILKKHGEAVGELVIDAIERYISPLKPTIRDCYQSMYAAMVHLNQDQLGEGFRFVPPISYSAFRLELRRYLARTAVSTPGSTAASLREAQMPNFARRGHQAVLEAISFEVKLTGVGFSRLVAYAAFDVATDYALGLSLGHRGGDHEAIFDVLRMMMRDKTELARESGAASPWHGCIVPRRLLISDGVGAGERVLEGLEGLGIEASEPPKRWRSHKRLEPLLRSFFKCEAARSAMTADLDSIVDRSVVDPAVAVLRKHLIGFICDTHHNAPSAALAGQTPLVAFEDSWRHHQLALPSTEQLRVAFGCDAKREVFDDGIRLAGMAYDSPVLVELRAAKPGVSVFVRYEEEDMRRISFEVDGAWYEADSAVALPEDVSFNELMDVYRRLKETEDRFDPSLVHEAIDELRKAS